METLKCVECGKNPIKVKKYKLCQTCYSKKYYRELRYSPERKGLRGRHPAEIAFIATYLEGKKWIYQPAVFNLNGGKYTPDFYDIDQNVFIEVIGGRQAYHQNRRKYQLFKKLFPKIVLELRLADGELFEPPPAGMIYWGKKKTT